MPLHHGQISPIYQHLPLAHDGLDSSLSIFLIYSSSANRSCDEKVIKSLFVMHLLGIYNSSFLRDQCPCYILDYFCEISPNISNLSINNSIRSMFDLFHYHVFIIIIKTCIKKYIFNFFKNLNILLSTMIEMAIYHR